MLHFFPSFFAFHPRVRADGNKAELYIKVPAHDVASALECAYPLQLLGGQQYHLHLSAQ